MRLGNKLLSISKASNNCYVIYIVVVFFATILSISKLAYQPVKAIMAPQTQQSNLYQGLVKLKNFEFEVIQLSSKGEIQKISKGNNQYFSEDLGEEETLDMVFIPEGSFMMGATEVDLQMDYEDVLKKGSFSMTDAKAYSPELPQHKVNIKSFFMSKFEVTQAQWKEVALLPMVKRKLKINPSKFKGSDLPVGKVSWEDCQEFCARLSRKTGKLYRLPREEEWEYACRAGTTTLFNFGDVITTNLANYDGAIGLSSFTPKGIYRGKTTPVGSFRIANTFGLYDMHGNVYEWCQDVAHRYDGTKLPVDTYRGVRGGGFASYVKNCRSASRLSRPASERDEFRGFRVAVSLN